MPQLSAERKARIDAFAGYVAVLPWFNIDVLHKLYLNIFQEHHPAAEEEAIRSFPVRALTCADLLQSPALRRIDYNVFVIERDLRDALRNQIAERTELLRQIGEFMISYAEQCRHQMLGLRYAEVFRIEGNLILNPGAEAERIVQHIADQVNRTDHTAQLEPSVAYYLNILEGKALSPTQQKLKHLLQGLNSYLKEDEAQARRDWEQLKGDNERAATSITIRLPRRIGEQLSSVVRPETGTTRRIFAVIVGLNAYPGDPLYGCIQDALAVHEFFGQLATVNEEVEEYDVRLLLAPHERDIPALEAAGLGESDYEAPTRENVINAFDHFAEADPERGDICLFYFAGYGSFQSAPGPLRQLSREVSTIVPLDSRQGDGLDLVSEELDYLMWKAVYEKYADREEAGFTHALMILDCGFSGDDAPRGSVLRSRVASPNPRPTPLDTYQGYREVLDSLLGPAMKQQSQKYQQNIIPDEPPEGEKIYLEVRQRWQSSGCISLLAARPGESSRELPLEAGVRGIFTYALLRTLGRNGLTLSYGELIERVKVMVRNRVEGQHPMLLTADAGDAYLFFLGGGLRAPVVDYLVTFDADRSAWILNAGFRQGIVPRDPIFGRTVLRAVREGDEAAVMELEVESVAADESVLRVTQPAEDAERYEDWRAEIVFMSPPTIKVMLEESVPEQWIDVLQREELLGEQPVYEFVNERSRADLVVHFSEGSFRLTRKGSEIPVVRPMSDPATFLKALQAIGQWQRILELDNTNTDIRRENIRIRAEYIEGAPLNLKNLDTVEATRREEDPKNIRLFYRSDTRRPEKQYQPAIRVELGTADRSLYLSALYLDSQYEIASNLDSVAVRSGQSESLKFTNRGQEYRTLPLNFDEYYHGLGVEEVTDYLKVFVSTEPLFVKGWEQDKVELEDQLENVTRGTAILSKGSALEEETLFDNTVNWAGFTIPVRIKRPFTQREIPFGGNAGEVRIAAIRMSGPADLSGKVSMATTGDIRDFLAEALPEFGADLEEGLQPPALLWGNLPSLSAAFSRGISAASPDEQLNMLELTEVKGAKIIDRGYPLEVKPLEGGDESSITLAYGFDRESELYLPLGFSDPEGKVRIEYLPPESQVKVVGNEPLKERLSRGSVKLFFKKLLTDRPETIDHLSVCRPDESGDLSVWGLKKGEVESAGKICLLLPGLIGNFYPMCQALYTDEHRLHDAFDLILCYEYEKLNTPFEETARRLRAELERAGLHEKSEKRLTLIAHGTGGLIARWLIEQEGGDRLIEQLIMLGTPQNGLPMRDFRRSLYSLLALAMYGDSSLKSFIPELALLLQRSAGSPFNTLTQLDPNESAFIRQLNGSARPVRTGYHLIMGDVNQIEPEKLMHRQEDLAYFWRRALNPEASRLLREMIFRSSDFNDLAFPMGSVAEVPNVQNAQMEVLPVDHLSYFSSREVLDLLGRILEVRSAASEGGNSSTNKAGSNPEKPGYGTFTDPRDGQTYRTIEINGQTWMAQNLNYDVGTGCWWYEDKPENGEKYGRLYTWEAAKNACPPGWRLPTDEEWRNMAEVFGGVNIDASGDGKAAYQSLIEGGRSGFSARLGGYRDPSVSFDDLGYLGTYWSATEHATGSAWSYLFYRSSGELGRLGDLKGWALSCRCVQDPSI